MDLRTGKIYESVEAAREAGVPESDIARIKQDIDLRKDLLSKIPEVSFDDHMQRLKEQDFQQTE